MRKAFTRLYWLFYRVLNSPRMTSGPLAWVIIMLTVVIFLLPYFIFDKLLSDFVPYGSFALVPLGLAAYFRTRRDVLIIWGVIVLGIAFALWINLGFFWPNNVITNYLFGNGIGLLISLVVAQVFRMQRQIVAARLDAQAKDMQLVQQRQAYEQQQTLNELKDQLILNLSHELRTPLTEVFGYLDMLEEYHQQLDEAQQAIFITHARNGCTELLELINTMLDAHQVDHDDELVPFEPISVAQLVQEIVDRWNLQIRQGYKIVMNMPEELTVQANPQYLRRILRNLLSNAISYSPLHSQVVVSATFSVTDVQKITASPYVCISVKDEGPGISSADIPLLFHKFVRLKHDLGGTIRGTGLGLYISKQLVEAMHGRIWVESSGRTGEGSRLCFTLPSASHAVVTEGNERIQGTLYIATADQ